MHPEASSTRAYRAAIRCANTVTKIDVTNGTIDASVAVGNGPSKLAISNDGQYLYVAIENARLSVVSTWPELRPARSSRWAQTRSRERTLFRTCRSLPGQPHTLAISRRRDDCCNPPHEGVAIYDDGVQRTNTTPRYPGNDVIVAASGSRLYGLDTAYGTYSFQRLTVDANGVSVDDSTLVYLAAKCTRHRQAVRVSR